MNFGMIINVLEKAIESVKYVSDKIEAFRENLDKAAVISELLAAKYGKRITSSQIYEPPPSALAASGWNPYKTVYHYGEIETLAVNLAKQICDLTALGARAEELCGDLCLTVFLLAWHDVGKYNKLLKRDVFTYLKDISLGNGNIVRLQWVQAYLINHISGEKT